MFASRIVDRRDRHFVRHICRSDSIRFENAIAPIFRQHCTACHHTKNAEGKLNLESYSALMQGGDSGAAIDLKQVEMSLLLERVTGRVEPIMPPPDNKVDAKPLSLDQIAIIQRWIESGAKSKSEEVPLPAVYQSLPDNIQTTYALTATPDGKWLVFSRGNDLVFQATVDWTKLTPSDSTQHVIENAHRDHCFSIAVSPDGQRIATGSSDEVKIWRLRWAKSLPNEVDRPNEPSSPPDLADANQPAIEPGKRLTLDGSSILQMTTSKNGKWLATIDEQHHLRIWDAKKALLVQDSTLDRFQLKLRERLERDVDRRKPPRRSMECVPCPTRIGRSQRIQSPRRSEEIARISQCGMGKEEARIAGRCQIGT